MAPLFQGELAAQQTEGFVNHPPVTTNKRAGIKTEKFILVVQSNSCF